MRADTGVCVLSRKSRDLCSWINRLLPVSACCTWLHQPSLESVQRTSCWCVKGKLRVWSGPNSPDFIPQVMSENGFSHHSIEISHEVEDFFNLSMRDRICWVQSYDSSSKASLHDTNILLQRHWFHWDHNDQLVLWCLWPKCRYWGARQEQISDLVEKS